MNKTIRPFEVAKEFMRIHNSLFDFVMPSLNPNAWKIYCFILRKTWGYSKDTDAVSYSQIAKGCGISSYATIQKAVKELKSSGFIFSSGRGNQTTQYRLNDQIEIDPDLYRNCKATITEIVKQTFTETVNTKDKGKRKKTLGAETAPSDIKTNTQNTEINMDFVDIAFDRAEKMAGNKDAVALTVIGQWNLSPHLSDICVEFVGIAHVPVSKGDKGKWARGASLIHEIAACRTMKAAYAKGRADGLTLTWPGALVELCRDVLGASNAAEIRAAQPVMIWVKAPSGEVAKVEACKREAALAKGYTVVNNDD